MVRCSFFNDLIKKTIILESVFRWARETFSGNNSRSFRRIEFRYIPLFASINSEINWRDKELKSATHSSISLPVS